MIIIGKKKGEMITMCEVVERFKKEGFEEGEKKGFEEGKNGKSSQPQVVINNSNKPTNQRREYSSINDLE